MTCRGPDPGWDEAPRRLTHEEIAERVAGVVLDVPRGRVTTYSDIAAVIGTVPRHVGRAMALGDGSLPWWRVTNVQGRLPDHLQREALARYGQEGTPVRNGHADVRLARWRPGQA